MLSTHFLLPGQQSKRALSRDWRFLFEIHPQLGSAAGLPSSRPATPPKRPSESSPSEELALAPYHTTQLCPSHLRGGAGLCLWTMTFKKLSCSAWKLDMSSHSTEVCFAHPKAIALSLCSVTLLVSAQERLWAGAWDRVFHLESPAETKAGHSHFHPGFNCTAQCNDQ